MPRANRFYLPGYIWHITHRCHNRDILLKFSFEKHRWMQWVFQAKKLFGLQILNYTVTSNHIHLLVVDRAEGAIARSMQLIAGRTAQEYNTRKNRSGAFWSDRYHATIVASDKHLRECMLYIDFNMVRAGVVSHPSLWRYGGYWEFQSGRQRYSIIDTKLVSSYFGFTNIEDFKNEYRAWTDHAIANGVGMRDPRWTESIAIGPDEFIDEVKEKLGFRATYRNVENQDESCMLREPRTEVYGDTFSGENAGLSSKNEYFWDIL